MDRNYRAKSGFAAADGDIRLDNDRVSEAVEAVCDELGIRDRRGRALIARRVSEAYARGNRQPLNLVSAGLGAP